MDRAQFSRLQQKASYVARPFPREHHEDLVAVAVIAAWRTPDTPFERVVMRRAMISYLRNWNGPKGRKRTDPLPPVDPAAPDPYEVVDAAVVAESMRAELAAMFPPRTVAILTAEADGTNLTDLAARDGLTGSGFSHLRTDARKRLSDSPTLMARLVA